MPVTLPIIGGGNDTRLAGGSAPGCLAICCMADPTPSLGSATALERTFRLAGTGFNGVLGLGLYTDSVRTTESTLLPHDSTG